MSLENYFNSGSYQPRKKLSFQEKRLMLQIAKINVKKKWHQNFNWQKKISTIQKDLKSNRKTLTIRDAFWDSDSYEVPDEGDAEVEHVLQALHHVGQETKVTLGQKYCWMPGNHQTTTMQIWVRSNYYESSGNDIRFNNGVWSI